jgi:hypothetical protein
MTRKPRTATNLPQPITLLHGGGPAIVWYTPQAVDGARLPYTREQLARRAARLGLTVREITESKRLPMAAGY